MTSLHWRLLLHYYAIAEPYAARDEAHANSPTTRSFTEQLVEWDLIVIVPTSGSGYRATARGEALVDFICNLPLPEQIWRMPPIPPEPRQ